EVDIQVFNGLVDESGQVIHEDPPERSFTDEPIDVPNIAPFLMEEPPSPTTTVHIHQHSHPSTSSKGFSKTSFTSLLSFRGNGGSTASLIRSSARGSGPGSTSHVSVAETIRRSSDDADSVRLTPYYPAGPSSSPQQTPELRKKSSKFNLAKLRRKGSKAHLHQNSQDETSSPPPPLPTKYDAQFVYNNPVEPPHPLAYLNVPPPVPPKEKSKDKKDKKRGRKRNEPPEPPPKDDMSLYPLDTNLESMEGIVDVTRITSDQLNPNSPGSASASFSGHQHQQSIEGGASVHSIPNFKNPFSPPSTEIEPTSIYGSSYISPTTIVPQPVNGIGTATASTSAPQGDHDPDVPRADDGTWKPPESWAVVDEYGLQNGKVDMTAPEDSDSDDDGSTTPEDSELTIRVYRPHGFYHSAAVGISLTVYDLLPALHRRTLTKDKQTSRLFLKERGKERILDVREIPLDIIYRRTTEAGYTWNDGLLLLGGEHMSFLLKFIYRDPDLGIGRRSFASDPQNPSFQDPTNELRLEAFDFVDLSARSLRAIPVLLHQHADQIVSLKLSRNPMIDLPLDFVEACTQLRDLRLSNMSMRKVPANLTAAKYLRRLDLASNYIKVRELEGGRLHKIPELRSLFLQNNILKDLPSTFANFQMLSTLNVSNNRLRAIPEVVMKITTLLDLDVSFNLIESLPENISDLYLLERFLFLGNSLTKIPDEFYELRYLTYVDCRRNQIGDLTIVMNLPRLKTLFADHNSIHLLDLSMGANLTTVDVSHNEITQVIGSLAPCGSSSHCLTILDLSHASLTTLDDGVLDKLTTLRILKLQHNSLSYIPDTLGELVQLQELHCFDNRLIKLPSTIGKLVNLSILDAHNNNLREVPTTIWDCAALRFLNLSSNFVTTFPPPNIIPIHGQSVGKVVELPKDYDLNHVIQGHLYPPLSFILNKLYLSENRISSHPEGCLRNIAFLRSLQSLNLSYNEINDFPLGFFRSLHKLKEIYLCGNGITALPADDFVRMRELQCVYLSGNKLTVLPAELTRLDWLRVIDVSNNNLRYNINNYEFDWNWNYNRNIQYLNLSGNKRLQIKSDNLRHGGSSRSSRESHGAGSLSGFASLRYLRNLGLMDLTVTASDLPDENEDRRIRSTASIVGGLGYGISDCLGREGAITMLDLVHDFPGHHTQNKALFAMFGNISPPKALPPGIFQNMMKTRDMQDSKHIAVDVLRRSFLGLHQMIHNQLFTPAARKASAGIGAAGTTLNVDPVTARGGCSGLVVYIEEKKLFAANVGTSLGIICRKGQAVELSTKHHPWNPAELRRIRKSEGWISPNGLVNDEVDVTRSFGYYHLLPVVHASPDICEYDIADTDEFLIMGNRGLWDYVSFQMAVDVTSTTNDPALVAQKLRDFAMSYGSTGNIMVMAIRLRDVHDKSIVRSSTILEPSLTFSPAVYQPKQSHLDAVDKSTRRSEPEVAPPTGHIALVFTDIRNSTHLWEVNPGMPAAIQLHNDLMRRRLRECGGYEFKTEGDAFLCSFPTVMAACRFNYSKNIGRKRYWSARMVNRFKIQEET
ncbi:Adenylate cyclase, partial [Leucoagaricus sp. SymC.cos]